ncbi:MAG: SAM-dependent methyltransferase [Gammaproteobacteria bacterium]|nr:SAM-dependent methyltransferase [Gammaproteobacteria bacterium]
MTDRAPLLTLDVVTRLRAAVREGESDIECSLDLARSRVRVAVDGEGFVHAGRRYPYPEPCRDRTIYYWDGTTFVPAARYAGALIKLVPTDWGAPTFEIDGIKMLPTARVSPYDDAVRKVALVEPAGRAVLDTCGGLGYFAAACLAAGAREVRSFEKHPDVVWLRSLNPWSPAPDPRLTLVAGDVVAEIALLPDGAFDAALHDPPRFGIAGELYSAAFYAGLARVLKRRARLFHYTGTPNKLTSGRDVPKEVAQRLQRAGFSTELKMDGVLAVKR